MKDPFLKNCRPLTQNSNNATSTSIRSISTSATGQELWPVGVKLGIVRLGYSAGKLKYTLVDEEDIVLARDYTFEARMEISTNSGSSSGAVVFAYAYQTSSSSSNRNMILLQDLIWRRHLGPIPDRHRVVHRNHISMDNRLDNLCLINIVGNQSTHVWYLMSNRIHPHYVARNHSDHLNSHHRTVRRRDNNNNDSIHSVSTNDNNQAIVENENVIQELSRHYKIYTNDLHLTLYWAAIQQLPPEHQSQQQSSSTSSSSSSHSSIIANNIQAKLNSATKCYDTQGNLICDQGITNCSRSQPINPGRFFVGSVYFECHYAPCVQIERKSREFSICGRCQEIRYCGTMCQQLDWPLHKRFCRYKARRIALAPYSSRSSPSRRLSNR
ncbi:hypothetical protein NH340_JMT06967 [Sarcoptes scabiei]|nr:hypothetical protein NH340_JMT06967 [Sarcoptes scabiei]